MATLYDTIGKSYSKTRAADPRITKRLVDLLQLPTGARLLDIGAGTGNYSCALAAGGYQVTALEPSRIMRDQGKKHSRLFWIAGEAESLPFESGSFDGIVMTLCIHHFSDWRKAFEEARRVSRDGPIVVFTFDPDFESGFWLFDYFPDFVKNDREWLPKIGEMRDYFSDRLGRSMSVHRFALPSDTVDHFAAAGWAKPELYLNETFRSGISSFARLDEKRVESGLAQLSEDLDSGAWDRKFGYLRNCENLDVGYIFLEIIN